jgi:hypothetical protein
MELESGGDGALDLLHSLIASGPSSTLRLGKGRDGDLRLDDGIGVAITLATTGRVTSSASLPSPKEEVRELTLLVGR